MTHSRWLGFSPLLPLSIHILFLCAQALHPRTNIPFRCQGYPPSFSIGSTFSSLVASFFAPPPTPPRSRSVLVVCQQCWLKWFMWRWILFSFVICHSHSLERCFLTQEDRVHTAYCREEILHLVDPGIFPVRVSAGKSSPFFKFHGGNGTLGE